MKKEEKTVRQLFLEDSVQKYICTEKKEKAIKLLMAANEAVGTESVKEEKAQRVTSFGERLVMQVKYMDKRQYYFQIAVVLAVIGFIFSAREIEQELFDTEIAYVTLSSVLFSTIAVITCSIGDKHGMAELTGSCFFNHMQMCVLRMALSGGISLGSMGALLCAAYRDIDGPLWQIGVYMLVPYFVTGCFQFALVSIEGLRSSQYALWIGGLIMMVVFGIAVSKNQIYEKASIGVWVLVLAVSAATMAFELAMLLKRIERGDILASV